MDRKYHRRRSLTNAVASNTSEQTPALARQVLQIAETECPNQSQERHGQIEVASVYEIDHTNLPPRTPVQLRSIRIVMVCEKTELNVAVRYPSIQSLQRYFASRNQEKYPEFDERFLMGTQLAVKVLVRRIPALELSLKKKAEDFWLVISSSPSEFEGGGVVSSKVGSCFSELNGNGMVRWGVRRQVRFIGRHRDPNPQSSVSMVRASGEETNCEGKEEKEEHEEEEEEAEEEEEQDEGEEEEDVKDALTEESTESQQTGGKRKRYSSRLVGKVKKLNIGENKKQVAKPKTKNNCRKMVLLKNPQDRWSAERYKQAEQNLLEVMKAKGAVYGKPILRPELRAEARKFIGDTGLLDHLLKHMAGKVAPGSNERFRRRHNAEGAMEYWLESADLDDIRRQAGIEDPYWTPPPGWVLGDSLTMDPISAKEIQKLKDELTKMRREVDNLVPKEKMEEELAKLRKEINELFSKGQQNNGAIVVSDPSMSKEQQMVIGVSSAPSSSELQGSLVNLEKDKDQHHEDVTKYCSRIGQEETREVKSKEKVGRSMSEPALMAATESSAQKERKKAESEIVQKQEEGKEARKTTEKAGGSVAEQKAARIQRLKSGFRICKPQGTFLWPNMVHSNTNTNTNMSSSQVVVQVEDFLMAPTPPSVNSSTASAPPQLPFPHHYHHPASPVKPMPERRAVTVTVSAVGDGGNFSTTTTTTTTTSNNNKTTTFINLNDYPNSSGDARCDKPPSRQTVTTASVMPRMVLPDTVAGSASSGNVKREKSGEICSSSPSATGSSLVPKRLEPWLAL